MNIRLRKIEGDGLFIEDYIKRRADENGIKWTKTRHGIQLHGDYNFNLDEEFKHPGFIRDSKIEALFDFLDEDFDNDEDETS